MAALSSVQDYISAARTLLQDTIEVYRYSNAELVDGLNFAVLEARRIRPDLFLTSFDDLPTFTAAQLADVVGIDPMYRLAFLYYVVGHAQVRDAEDTTDARAAAFFQKFKTTLATLG